MACVLRRTSANKDQKVESERRVQISSGVCLSKSPLLGEAWEASPFPPSHPSLPPLWLRPWTWSFGRSPATSRSARATSSSSLVPALLPTPARFSPCDSNILALERTLKSIWDDELHCPSACPVGYFQGFLLP